MIWGNGAMIAEVAGTQTATPEYRLLDHLGSLAAETNGSGTVTGSNVFLPFGQLVSSTTNDSFQFTGLEQDTENSSDHAWFRNLSTEQSRWLRPDPYNGSYDVTNPQSLNRYAYVLNNPLAFTDPSGLWVPPPPPSIICVQLGGDSWNVSTNAGGNWPGSTPSQNSCNGFGVGDGSGNGNGGAGAGGGSNGSTNPNNCTGSGVSIGAGGNADLGFFEGASAQGSAMAGTTTTATGGTLSGGAMAGGPFGTVGAPTQTTNSVVFGSYAGVGVQVGVTNAGSMQALSGPFKTFSVNAGFANLNFGFSASWSGNIFQFTFTPPALSYGFGFGASYTTTTTKQKTINAVHNGPC